MSHLLNITKWMNGKGKKIGCYAKGPDIRGGRRWRRRKQQLLWTFAPQGCSVRPRRLRAEYGQNGRGCIPASSRGEISVQLVLERANIDKDKRQSLWIFEMPMIESHVAKHNAVLVAMAEQVGHLR